jgi:transposase
MLKVDTQSWQQNPELLRQQAFTAEHPRTRERFMGLYEITNGKNATQVGQEIGRNPQTIMGWVHQYNTLGPEALLYRRTGGRPPLYRLRSKKP